MDANFPEVAVDSFFGRAKKLHFKYPKGVVVKSPQFSFARLLGADPVLRIEMSSTGEAACFGRDYDEALLKSILSTNQFDFKNKAVLLSLGGDLYKAKFLDTANTLISLGYKIFATDTTAEFFKNNKIKCKTVRKAFEATPNALNIIESKKVAFVVNLSVANKVNEHDEKRRGTDGFHLRRCVDNQIIITDHTSSSLIRRCLAME